MLYDHRTYTCKAGTVRKHLELYLAHGYAAQSKHLGKPALYAVTEVGDVNSYVHVWSYKDAADRTVKRAAMMADPAWQNYIKVSGEAGYLIKQDTKLMLSVDLPG